MVFFVLVKERMLEGFEHMLRIEKTVVNLTDVVLLRRRLSSR